MRKARHIVVGPHDFARRGWETILDIERASFDDGLAWERSNYEKALTEGAFCVTAFDGVTTWGVCWCLDGEIFSLAVHPAGRERGIAKRLIRYITKRLRRQGRRTAFLNVEPRSIPALRLYIKLGFRPDSYEPNYHGSNRGALHMVKKL